MAEQSFPESRWHTTWSESNYLPLLLGTHAWVGQQMLSTGQGEAVGETGMLAALQLFQGEQ